MSDDFPKNQKQRLHMISSTEEFITRRVDSKKKLQTVGVSYLMIMSSHEVLLKEKERIHHRMILYR